MSQNELGKYSGKRNSKKGKGKGGALAGRGLAFRPLAEAGPAHQRAFPLPVPAPASTRDGRPRRAAVASRQNSAAAWRACAGVDTPWSATRSPGRARLPLRCHSRSSTLPLSLSHPCSARAKHHHACGPRATVPFCTA